MVAYLAPRSNHLAAHLDKADHHARTVGNPGNVGLEVLVRTFQKTLVIIGTLIVDVPILVGSFWLGYKLVMGLQSPPQHIRAFIFDKFMGPFLLFFFIP